jgi:hypothetical protein
MHYRARTYFPEIGRFSQRDPAERTDRCYKYVLNRPVSIIDPSGLGFIKIIEGSPNVVQFVPEGDWGKNLWSQRIDLGTSDVDKVVTFYQQFSLDDMPLKALEDLVENVDDKITPNNLLKEIAAVQATAKNQEGGYTGGSSPADYYWLRMTSTERMMGDPGLKQCMDRIGQRGAKLAGFQTKSAIIEGAVFVGVEATAGTLFIVSGPVLPVKVGAGALAVLGLVPLGMAAKDITDAVDIYEAARKAQKRYCK